ncbi:Putative gamma-tubulin complex component protein [Septoria linicola]|uniref:Spindle pole body component n=1 Tax=Septoria linicola TaxID=215465 RepID=A0A9Q9EJI7_9PEZI|nr:Putative gamma-tubulin complex component protein [Septoria linicola]
MEDPLLRGLPFEAGALWPASICQISGNDETIFEALSTDFEALSPLKKDEPGHFDLHTDLPELEQQHEVLEPPSRELQTSLTGNAREDENRATAWDFDIDQDDGPELPRFHTWEGFGKLDDKHAEYLSEAGPAAFDAALQSVEKSIGVLPQSFTLRALCSLALGRSSSLFQWSHERNEFIQTLEGARISGMSRLCSGSLAEDLLDLGNMTVRLRTLTESPRNHRACPAAMALRSCVGIVVDAVESRISSSAGTIRSSLQLQEVVTPPIHLLGILTKVIAQTKADKTDEELISSLSELVHEYAESESRFCAVLHTLLARVSMPWLESLSVDLGLQIDPTGQLEGSATQDMAVGEEPRHSFLNSEDQNLVCATKQAVWLLRAQCPEHPLFRRTPSSTAKKFRESRMGHRETERAAKQYEARMTKLLLHGEDKNEREANIAAASASEPSHDGAAWTEASQMSFITQSGDVMSLEPGTSSSSERDKLRELADYALSAAAKQPATESLRSDAGHSPIEQIQPFIRAQHKLVNGVILRQLMQHHKLRQQLEKQRAFQLLGNGSFAARLAKALFDKDVQSAERKRGVVPTADDMGLRVGANKDQRWPPASSELQLSLMGLLNEAAGGAVDIAAKSQLSFAIRELPEEEIERVLDPYSIYALDFLRLQYTTHEPISAVITPASLQQYDGIFRYLLKLLRLLHVTTDLPRTVPGSRDAGVHRNTLAFAQQAREFVTVLTGHVMSVGIAPPWQTLTTVLRTLERNLQAEDEQGKLASRVTMDVEGLRELHERCLDRIRTRLFLKKKQEKLRVAVEDVLSSILKCATGLQASVTDVLSVEDHASFTRKLQKLITQLAEIADKPPRTVSAADAEDLDMVRLLLAKLDWNGYYTNDAAKVP